MKVKLEQFVACQIGLNKIIEKELPVLIAYRLGKMAKVIKSELLHMDEIRSRLIQQLGELMPNTEGRWRVKPENTAAFEEEMGKLLKEEVELDCEPISVLQLGDIKVTPLDLAHLDFIITE